VRKNRLSGTATQAIDCNSDSLIFFARSARPAYYPPGAVMFKIGDTFSGRNHFRCGEDAEDDCEVTRGLVVAVQYIGGLDEICRINALPLGQVFL